MNDMTPVSSNTFLNTCSEPISSNCVQSQLGPIPGLPLCAGATQTQVDAAIAGMISGLITQMNTLAGEIPVTPPIINFTSLVWGCVYPPTTTTYTCSCGSYTTVILDSTSPNGIGYCQNAAFEIAAACFPVGTTVVNTPPTTLLGTLQVIINFLQTICPCLPCANKGSIIGP